MDDPDSLSAHTAQRWRAGQRLTRGLSALVFAVSASLAVGMIANAIQRQVRNRQLIGQRLTADQVRVLSTTWREPDLFQVVVRLSRSDGQPLFSHQGIRLIDLRSNGEGVLSDYGGRTRPGPAPNYIDVLALQRLESVPTGAVPLRIEGFSNIPRLQEPWWAPWILGPLPKQPQKARYPLRSDRVTLPVPSPKKGTPPKEAG